MSQPSKRPPSPSRKAASEPKGFDLEREILRDHSVAMRQRVQDWVGDHPFRFADLLNLVLHGKKATAQRACWPLTKCAEAHPHLAEPHLAELLENLKRRDLHGAVVRNTFRIFQFVEIPPELEERVFSACMAALGGPTEVAVKAFSITVLRRLVERFPELRAEVVGLITELLPTQTVAFRARAKNEFGIGKRPRKGASDDAWDA